MKWQEDQKAKKQAKSEREKEAEALDAKLTAEGCSKSEIRRRVKFDLNKKEAGVQTNAGKVKILFVKGSQKLESTI